MSYEHKKPRRGPRPATAAQKLLTFQQIESEDGIPYTSVRDLALRGLLPVVRFEGSSRMWVQRSDWEDLKKRSRENRGEAA
jgi:hypothetical protein